MSDPRWLAVARTLIGVAEIPGPRHSSVIIGWLDKLGAWWRDDETPWCGVFVAHCMQECGIALPKYWMRAKAWAEWGGKLAAPSPGCVVVFEREGGGHVGIVVGLTAAGHLLVLGGNQGNKVSIAPFDRGRVIAYAWPPGEDRPQIIGLPTLDSVGDLSQNEA